MPYPFSSLRINLLIVIIKYKTENHTTTTLLQTHTNLTRNKQKHTRQSQKVSLNSVFMFVIFWFFLASSIFFSAVRSFDLLGRKTYHRNGRGRYLSDTGEVEDFFPKFHRCLDAGEAYSASYFMTKKYLIARKTDNNLTWVNCEMGSLIMVSQSRRYVNRAIGGIVQSLDILDFSVIHLSAYERLIKRHWRKLQKGEKSYSVVDVVREAVRRLNYKSTISPEFSKAPFQV